MNREMIFCQLMRPVLGEGATYSLSKELMQMGFFSAPASTKYHGNYQGGLFDHSIIVTKELLNLTEKLDLRWGREESPYLVGMLHDLCKCDAYIPQNDGSYEYNDKQTITGHGEKSVIYAQKIYDLTNEEILCIRWHMGAYEGKEVWKNLGEAIKSCPNILYTHTADMIASQIQGT